MAAVVRLPRVLADDFPINDGGFFFVMINELVGAKLALPLTTSYNGGCIPFTYPPLALYTAAAVHLATGASILGLLRFLPLIANLGTAAVFFFLARSVLGTASRAGLASLTFVLLPRSYEYLIMGGGLTRSFGFLFACLAVACGHRLFVGRRTAAGVPTAVALALAVLSHPEMGLWAAATLVLVVAVCGPDRRTIVAAAFVAVGAAAITSPWLVAMLTRHGLAPFLAASETSNWSLRALLGPLARGAAGEVGVAPFVILAFVGVLDAIVRREFFLPVWLVVTFAVVPRSAATPAVVPVALLATRALVGVVLPWLQRFLGGWTALWRGAPGELGQETRRRALRAIQAAVLVPAFGYTLIISNLRRTPEDWPSMRRVPPAERVAMAWIAANVGEGHRFLVASANRSWWVDPVDAWFAALAGRVSVTTPNGAEWLPRSEFARRVQEYEALRRCGSVDAACLDALSARFGLQFSDVYVSKPTRATSARAAAPKATLAASDGFVVIYDGPGATVFAKREAVTDRVHPVPPARDAVVR